MAITIPTQYVPTSPSTFVCGFNPIIYTFVFDIGSPPTVYTDLKAYVKLYDRRNADALIGLFYYDAYTSGSDIIATADVSDIIKSYLLTATHISTGDYIKDEGLTAKIKVGFGSFYRDGTGTPVVSAESFFSDDLRPTWAVAQVTQNKNLRVYTTDTPMALLSDMDKIYMFQYNGSLLPSEVDFIHPDYGTGDTLMTSTAGSPVTIPSGSTHNELYHVRPQAAWHNYQVYLRDTTLSTPWSTLKYAKLIQVYENPFFVRWLNQRGGYDYWCFTKRQTITNQTSEVKTSRSYIENPLTATKTHTKIDCSAAVKYQAGGTNLSALQWEVINWLAVSPDVQYYDIDTGVWIGVIVEGVSNSYVTDKPAGKLEFTFVMPEILTQY